MRVGIIGTGKMGRALASAWSSAGHVPVLGSRDPARAGEIVASRGRAIEVRSIADAVRSCDVIALATPWHGTRAILEAGSPLAGKVVIDATNPPYPTVATDKDTGPACGAGQIARWAAGSRVVKALNAVAARIVGARQRQFDGSRVTVPYCGDDREAKATVADLIAAIDFDPYDAGPLEAARHLESLARAMVGMDVAAGRGNDIGFSLLRRPSERP